MAIDRKDYQYIHNTLEKSSNINSNSRLKIGSQIENLLPEVKDLSHTGTITQTAAKRILARLKRDIGVPAVLQGVKNLIAAA